MSHVRKPDPCVVCGTIRLVNSARIGTQCRTCWKSSLDRGYYDPLYGLLHGIKQRCYRKERKDYPRYGGRGITVCEQWLANSSTFIRWARANGYEKGLQIDRKDNDGHYSPENCEWVTPAANVRKSSMTKLSIEVVPAISWFIRMGYKDTEIGATFFVHRRTISDIRLGKTWSDISGLGATASA